MNTTPTSSGVFMPGDPPPLKFQRPPSPQLLKKRRKEQAQMQKIVDDRKDAIGLELAALRNTPTTPDLSESAAKVLGYATHFMAQNVSDVHRGKAKVTEPLEKRVVGRLVRGTESMDYTRRMLNEGRGNVDDEDPRFPEAVIRTELSYKHAKGPEHKKAAILEAIRAGNCDHHAVVAAMHAGAHLPDDEEHVSRVRYPGHAFAELRGAKGKTAVDPKDVIVDSWSSSPHAVLREDAHFAAKMHPTTLDMKTHRKTPFTWYTADKQQGQQNFQAKQHFIAHEMNPHFASSVDRKASRHRSKDSPFPSWAPTEMTSDSGDARIAKRQSTFNRQNALTKNIQTVHTARQMGATIRGAVKHAKHRDP